MGARVDRTDSKVPNAGGRDHVQRRQVAGVDDAGRYRRTVGDWAWRLDYWRQRMDQALAGAGPLMPRTAGGWMRELVGVVLGALGAAALVGSALAWLS